tara:strand:- start:2074 stop:2586 length:513 start_codon:yes stop_codon:yes gene_type:complete
MKIYKTKFKDLLIIKSKNYYDQRGIFRELSKNYLFKKKLIFTVVSISKKNVLRGLHMQKNKQQDKFLSVVKGKILDVVVDCRKNSKTYGKYYKTELSDKNEKSIYIPKGFLHGFLCLEKENIVIYSCTNYRDKKSEIGVKWNDKNLKINWPIKKPILSNKDKKNLFFKDL